MRKYTSGRQKDLKIGIVSYSENLISLDVIGNVSIGGTIVLNSGISDKNGVVGSANSVLTADGAGGWLWKSVGEVGPTSNILIENNNTGLKYPLFFESVSTSTDTLYADNNGLVYNSDTNCLGIGTTVPTVSLDVNGDAKISGELTTTDFNLLSDLRLKTNINIIKDPLDKILKINGVTFEWKETGKKSVGVIAQEIEMILPELVSEIDETKRVNYIGLISVLIESVKELKDEIEFLKTKIKH